MWYAKKLSLESPQFVDMRKYFQKRMKYEYAAQEEKPFVQGVDICQQTHSVSGRGIIANTNL